MLRTVVFVAVAAPATLLFSGLAVLGGLVGAPRGFFDWIHRTWSRTLLGAGGVRVEVEGLQHVEAGAAHVVAANHQSLFDIPALFVALPLSLRFVAKEELSRVPVFAAAMRRAGHVFIDRGDRVRAVEAMRRAGRRMEEEGLSLGLFPEGSRSPDGRLRPFKKGAFGLAIETGTVLLPVAVDGGARILPKAGKRIRPGTIRVRCGPPVSLADLGREERGRLARQTRETVARMLDRPEARR